MRPNPKEIKEAVSPSIRRNTATSKPTSTNGSGETVSLLKVSESANPVVTTAQLVVASSPCPPHRTAAHLAAIEMR